jgi:hypothetical protein
MKLITLLFSILILAFANTAFAQTSKTYLQLSAKEQNRFIATKVAELSVVKDFSKVKIPDAAIIKIKAFVDGYAKRLTSKKLDKCGFGDNLQSVYERAAKNAPIIIEAFNQEKVDPQVGLYLAMIESEHCVCLQSPTGPLGLFQLSHLHAEEYGLKVFKNASPSNPDERCDTKSASSGVAKILNSMARLFEDVPSKFLFTVALYNSNESPLSATQKLVVGQFHFLSNKATISKIPHNLFVTPASIAGVQRSVL